MFFIPVMNISPIERVKVFCSESRTRTEGPQGHFVFACALATLSCTTRLHYPSRARCERDPLISRNFRSPFDFEDSPDYP